MKQKTHSGSKKRIKITKGGKGKMMMAKAAKNHLLSSKSKRQKKFGRLGILVPTGMKKHFARLLKISQ